MHPAALPPRLGTSFSVAEAHALGVTDGRMRSSDLEIPFRGVRRAVGSDGDGGRDSGHSAGGASSTAARGAASNATPVPRAEHAARLQARAIENAITYAHCMTEHEFFSHVTAAIIWDIPLPFAVIEAEELHVSVLAPHRASKRSNVTSHQARTHLVTVRTHPGTGLRVSSPASTWASLGSVLRHPYDVVAAADAVVRIPRMPGGFAPRPDARTEPLATLQALEACVRSGRRVGIDALRAALPRVRTGASSRTEVWTRLTLIDAGLPEPVLDYDVYDEHGIFVACLDMAYPELRIAIEYDGDQHRTDPAQWARDIDRLEALAALGWYVIRVSSDLLFQSPRELVRRVAAARARRGA